MKKKIMVVDDNRMTLNFLIRTLEQEGHQVISAEDGLSALDILTSFTPDIIFLDLIIPKIDGEKLCQIIRKMKHLSECYIVILSAAVAEMDPNYSKIGANTCIAKGPFSKMAGHVLAAVKESDASRDQKPTHIHGLNGIHARQMTKELLTRNYHLETILESIAEGILEVYSGRVVYANSAVVSIFGLPEEKILASYFEDLFDEDLKPRVKSLLRSKEGCPSEIGLNSPLEINGKMATIKCLPVKHDPLTTIILITDVTKGKQLEMQLQHIQKMEAIGTIASGVAHNFRNTLAGILANSQVIQLNLDKTSGLQANVDRISTSVKRGVQLIEGLMQFSRKQIKNEYHRLNLVDVIQETHQLVKESFDKSVTISMKTPAFLPIQGDYLGLSHALMNLCTNARDAMPGGGQLEITAKAEDKMAVVTVSDTGLGMDEDILRKCFDPFFTTKEFGKGTGLGLSTTYGIIKNHEGEIIATSEPNKGSVFTLRLPLATFGKKKTHDSKPEILKGHGEKVLVVDDETELLNVMPDLLDNLGYKSAVASSGKEAITIYKTWQPDVVLMDISMPKMDGYTCIEKIMEVDPNVKAIIVTGHEKDGPLGWNKNKKKFIRGFLTKPVDIFELGTSLAHALK